MQASVRQERNALAHAIVADTVVAVHDATEDAIKSARHTFYRRGFLMSAEQSMREKLIIGLSPIRLDVVNESELHAGHRSSPGTGESHFRILVVSDAFTGKSRVERHRMINALLSDELAGRIHALALKAYAPGEAIA